MADKTAIESTERTVRSRDRQWIYHLCGNAPTSWVNAITHEPSGTRIPYSGTIASARADAQSGRLLDHIPTKIKRGPVTAVVARRYSEPIPDEFLPLIEAAGLVADDNDHVVIFYTAGEKCGSVWGPAVEGDWFAYRDGGDPVRVKTRNDALRHVLRLGATETGESRG